LAPDDPLAVPVGVPASATEQEDAEDSDPGARATVHGPSDHQANTGVFNWEEGPGADDLAPSPPPRLAPSRSVRNRNRIPSPVPASPVPEGDAVKTRGTPDWMARRIAESRVPGAAYELGKNRRWRRRKVTVLRSRANRRLVRRIDTWTVFKVSFVFYLLMLVIVLVAGTVSWNVAEHLGFVNDIQKSVRSLADDKKFVFRGRAALRYSAAGGAVLGLLGTLFNTVAAMLYNLLSDVIGGLQVIVVTEPD
jgi:hypothetical protein